MYALRINNKALFEAPPIEKEKMRDGYTEMGYTAGLEDIIDTCIKFGGKEVQNG